MHRFVKKNNKFLIPFMLSVLYFAVSDKAYAVEAEEELVELSLEDMLNMQVVEGTLTGTTNLKVPVAITTITKEEIKLTPAANIYDLLEVYVPGALYMNHGEGKRVGMRGIIADRNYKFILLVNGINLNQKVHNGVTGELDHWDLNDIEKIQVIRGPGSVTYGAGAIGGIINIITKQAVKKPQNTITEGIQYFYPYNSIGNHIETNISLPNVNIYAYGSGVKTTGVTPKAFSVDNSDSTAGYIGKDFTKGKFLNPPNDIYRDSFDQPQIKLHANMNLFNEWDFWARYSDFGGSYHGVISKSARQTGLNAKGEAVLDPLGDGGEINRYKQLTLTLKNDHYFSDNFQLESDVSYYTQDYQRQEAFLKYDSKVAPDIQKALSDPNSLINQKLNFSEAQFQAKTIGKLSFLENKYKFALGGEYVYNFLGSGWGDPANMVRFGDKKSIISGKDSPVYNINNSRGVKEADAVFIGNGWGTQTYSILGEANLDFNRYLNVFLGGRMDKNDYSQFLLSPRIALVSEIFDGHYLKLIAQNSNRMNTLEQLLEESRKKQVSDPETLTSYELMYSAILNKNLSLSLSGFYNLNSVIAWNTEQTKTFLIGDLTYFGVEPELKFSNEFITLGINHSFIKQLSWKLKPGVDASGISYSDYNVKIALNKDQNVFIKGVGNDLNNWSNNSTKLFLNLKPGAVWSPLSPVTLHLNTRLFYNFEGAKDGFTALENTVKGTDKEKAVATALTKARTLGAYETDLKFSAAINYKFSNNISLNVYGLNIAGIGNNKRYTYDSGVRELSPSKLGWVEEPAVYGASFDYTF